MLYSTYHLNKVPLTGLAFGDKGDALVYTAERMPPGCSIFKVLGVEYRFNVLYREPAESASDAIRGWSVTKQNDDPRDFGVKIHWWYNTGGIQLRVQYVVRQPWNVDCLVPGKMQTGK